MLGLCNPNWQSKTGVTCAEYKENKLCTITGEYGPGWAKWCEPNDCGTFENLKNSFAESALVCPQCGCKGYLKDISSALRSYHCQKFCPKTDVKKDMCTAPGAL